MLLFKWVNELHSTLSQNIFAFCQWWQFCNDNNISRWQDGEMSLALNRNKRIIRRGRAKLYTFINMAFPEPHGNVLQKHSACLLWHLRLNPSLLQQSVSLRYALPPKLHSSLESERQQLLCNTLLLALTLTCGERLNTRNHSPNTSAQLLKKGYFETDPQLVSL